MNVKKVIVRGKNIVFQIPQKELFCEKCETTNFIYDDMKTPHKCDNCGELLMENVSDAD